MKLLALVFIMAFTIFNFPSTETNLKGTQEQDLKSLAKYATSMSQAQVEEDNEEVDERFQTMSGEFLPVSQLHVVKD
ncbi:MAG: hypothetical protein AAFY71_12845 [Bacteroidota bacterium]